MLLSDNIFMHKALEAFPLKLGTREGHLLSSILFNAIDNILTQSTGNMVGGLLMFGLAFKVSL